MGRTTRASLAVVIFWLLDASMALMHKSSPAHTALDSSGQPHGQWLGKNGDAHRSGASHSIAPRELANGPAWEWRAAGETVVRATPLIDEEQNLFLATVSGDIHKFNRGGELLWTFSTDPFELPSVPAMLDGVIYVINKAGVLLAVDAKTGQLVWDLKVAQEVGGDTHSVLAVDGLVIVSGLPSFDNGPSMSFSAISVKDKKEVWRFEGAPVYNFLAAAYNGSVLFESVLGEVYRVSLADGSLIWKQEPLADEASRAFTTGGVAMDDNGNVYATHNYKLNGSSDMQAQGVVTARRFSDGKLLWHREFEHAANAGPAVGRLDGTADSPLAVFVPIQNNGPSIIDFEHYALEDGSAFALDAVTGETLWQFDFAPWYGGTRGDTLQHVCWPDAFANPAVDGQGTVYFGRNDGFVYAIHDDNHDKVIDASEVSRFDAGAAYQGSPAISDNMVALADCAGLRLFMQMPK